MKIKKSAAYALHALMYMVRHKTQLPVTTRTIAKAEGIPADYLAKVFQKLKKASFVKSVKGNQKGYVFGKSPEEITLLELIEAIEGGSLFNECFMKHCICGGTKSNCRIYSIWIDSTRHVVKVLEETTVESAAWSHPEHRFNHLPEKKDISTKK